MFDNYDMWEFNEAKMEAWLNKRPICCHCGHHIQGDWMYDINGSYYHVTCVEDNFLKCTEDYLEGE